MQGAIHARLAVICLLSITELQDNRQNSKAVRPDLIYVEQSATC